MRVTTSLSNRIFLACTVLATLPMGAAFYLVSARAEAEVEAELRRGLAEAGALVDERRATLTDTYTTYARLIADLPRLKAAVDTGDPPTVQPLADEYRRQIGADLLLLTTPRGLVLGSSGSDVPAVTPTTRSTEPTEERSAFLAHPRGLLHVVSVPLVVLDGAPAHVLGRLTVGFFLDDRMAAQFKRLTGSEIAFVAEGRVVATSLQAESVTALPALAQATGVTSATLGSEEFLVDSRPIPRGEGRTAVAPTAAILIMRSRTEQLRFLSTLRTGLAGALISTLLLATILSYGVARTVTRPLAAVTGAMREVAATGDLTRKVPVLSRAWDDEDARLLGTAFNTLTDSIARFQREAAQRERLSSLGRMSTVIAHEVRNPLMIIRASLTALRAPEISSDERREAVADIDEETRRINRLVSEVLDFAKPIRFDLADASVNDVCRASAAAAWAGDDDDDVRLDLAPTLPALVTDAERLRTALVNILANARHAVAARTTPGTASSKGGVLAGEIAVLAEPGIVIATELRGDRIVIAVTDRGNGIAIEDLPHIFDPYYTTRRAGTGLGLPIAKNIIEGLGGTISVSSRRHDGTRIEIELPSASPEVAA